MTKAEPIVTIEQYTALAGEPGKRDIPLPRPLAGTISVTQLFGGSA